MVRYNPPNLLQLPQTQKNLYKYQLAMIVTKKRRRKMKRKKMKRKMRRLK